MKNTEQELKLQLDRRQYFLLQDYAKVTPQLQTNYYFGATGMPQDVMVRIRQKQQTYLLCYKKQLTSYDGVVVCDERECEISADYAKSLIFRGILASELKQMLDVSLPQNLSYLGLLETYRTKFTFLDWTIELDKNQYLGETDYELECECDRVESLQRLCQHLNFHFGIQAVPSAPKVNRFFRRLQSSNVVD